MANWGRLALAGTAAMAVVIGVPGAGFAGATPADLPDATSMTSYASFTPAAVDPRLARRLAASMGLDGVGIGFTPAGSVGPHTKTVTVAVRVDAETARAISIRTPARQAAIAPGGLGRIALAPTRYDLGVSRGYQGFATKVPKLAEGLRLSELPDLADLKPVDGEARGKPSRFQPRIVLDTDSTIGRAPRTLGSLGDQSVDLGGSYRLSRNLDVTAGVRLSQERGRDRLDPLTDNVQDSQAVYVGTQLRF